MNKLIILSAPSGAGKSTIVKALKQTYPQLELSISACTRSPRNGETHGVDYYFLDVPTFQKHIADNDFVEWEMVYEGKYYGTLQAELERIWEKGHLPILDIDVQGAINLMKHYSGNCLSMFIMPPDLHALKERLENRGTETAESLAERVGKAADEIALKDAFHYVIINDQLEQAIADATKAIKDYL